MWDLTQFGFSPLATVLTPHLPFYLWLLKWPQLLFSWEVQGQCPCHQPPTPFPCVPTSNESLYSSCWSLHLRVIINVCFQSLQSFPSTGGPSSLSGGLALKFVMPFIDFTPLKMFRLGNALPLWKSAYFHDEEGLILWRYLHFIAVSFYEEMYHGARHRLYCLVPFLWWRLYHQDSQFCVLVFILCLCLLFYTMPKEGHECAEMKAMLIQFGNAFILLIYKSLLEVGTLWMLGHFL